MPTDATAPIILTLPEALAAVRAQAAQLALPRSTEHLTLLDAAGRILAREIASDRDQPPFDRATRDGFAVRSTDLEPDATLRVVGSVRAGEAWSGAPLASGEAIELMTGAPLPSGADAVLMVEHAELHGEALTPAAGRILRAGENVVPHGCEARAGSVVVARGALLGAAEIALAAACGAAELEIAARPRVAVLATGDELVEIGETPLPQQIRNSNGYALSALVAAAGGEPVRLPITPDRRDGVGKNIREAAKCDLILLSGGVSMGKYDLVEEVLTALGAEFFFTGVRMQPGRPVIFGRLPAGPYFFGLPGNPISTQVTFTCFAAPLLRAMAGAAEIGPRFAQATLAEDVEGNEKLHRLLPARMTSDLNGAEVRLAGWRSSGDLAANARANCYAVLPPERERFAAGDVISVLLG